jgi:hypothetical protein
MNKRFAATLLAVSLVGLALAPSASAAFGFSDLDVTFTTADGSPATQAGSHPFAMTTTVRLNTVGKKSDGSIKDLEVDLPAGLAVDPTAVPRCSSADFLSFSEEEGSACPDAAALGFIEVIAAGESTGDFAAVYNLAPPPGVASKLGFHALGVAVTLNGGVRVEGERKLFASLANIAQAEPIGGSVLTIWGNPANPVHDPDRGNCIFQAGSCRASIAERPFLTMPRSCTGPLPMLFEADSWEEPGVWVKGSAETHDNAEPPSPLGMTGCSRLGFSPSITAKPTSRAASSPTGLDFSLDVHDEGLGNPDGLAQSDISEAVVTLPEGFSVNPSIAEGLEVCSEAQLDSETAFSPSGAGCPEASKIGTVEVETPLLDQNVNGALYIAKPYENPFGTLLALYIVIKNPTLGIVVKQAAKVEPDPVTGQLTTVAEDLPQLPFSHFRLHFREGTRSPLASPLGCGTYDVKALLTPRSGGAPLTTTSAFQIVVGPNAGPCPTGGLPSFHPGLIAGSLNNAAGRFSPFNVRLFRSDSEQEITRFSIKLPPGLAGKLAGIPFCPDAAIAAAKARTGPHGGQEELQAPSCPAASEIGHTLVGSGVGPSLAYAPGKLYLAGPYNGSAISLVSITAGVVGPFDIGTVVVREAFKIDPETAEVFIDSTNSDPIPHIIQGIPVHLRDIRAYTDRPNFVLNPTDCTRTSTASTLLGSGLDFASQADDNPIVVSTPYQAADCAALPFDPKLKFSLLGGTKRGAHPAFRAALKMRGIGEAAIAHAQVTLPRSEFLEQAHIKTICTRVQFKAGSVPGAQCPAGSVYGFAKAITPLLDEPLQGPVFLRSSEHKLPDLVAALHNGKIDINLVGRVDSVNGGIRNTFELVPDAPVDSFTLTMQGGKKGLLVNSTDLCKGTHRAKADFTAHNGKVKRFRPALKAKCPKGRSSTRSGPRRAP